MLGNLDDVAVLDQVGLTDRLVARYRVAEDEALLPAIHARYDGPDAVRCLRLMRDDGQQPVPLEGWLAEGYPFEASYRAGIQNVRWSCASAERPSEEVVLERWTRLFERYPTLPWLRWQVARSLADQGELEQALALGTGGTTFDAPHDMPASLSFTRVPVPSRWVHGRGFALVRNGLTISRPLSAEELGASVLVVDVDAPGEEGAHVEIGWEGCEEEPVLEVVRKPAELGLEPPTGCTAPYRLTVRFLNDASGPEGDRNVYVSIRPGDPG